MGSWVIHDAQPELNRLANITQVPDTSFCFTTVAFMFFLVLQIKSRMLAGFIEPSDDGVAIGAVVGYEADIHGLARCN